VRPEADAEGRVWARAVLRLDGASGAVLSHVESLDAVQAADSNRLRNRKVAQDAATLLDFRRPSSVCPDDWAAAVSARVLSGVPGTGVLDVDPNEEPLAVAVFGLVVIAGLSVSIATIGDETGVFGRSIIGDETGILGRSMCDEVAGNDFWYAQCVSDIF